jgi:hypothetical protein
VGRVVAVPVQAVPDQHLVHTPSALLRGKAIVGEAEGDVLGHGRMDDLCVGVLEDEANSSSHLA